MARSTLWWTTRTCSTCGAESPRLRTRPSCPRTRRRTRPSPWRRSSTTAATTSTSSRTTSTRRTSTGCTTAKKTTKVVRFDAPNVVRHAGVSGFSEEFHIVPIGPQRTRVLLRQRIPKGPILSTLLKIPKSTELVQFLVRQWNYQIGLEDYSVMQGQAHNIDDLGAPNWKAASTGDDLIIKFWKSYQRALENDGFASEYFTRYDGSLLDEAACNEVR